VIGGTERILFDTYDAATGERVRRTRYSALDVDASRVIEGVAHSPEGVVAISYGIREIGYEGDFLLLTSVDDPESFTVVRMPLEDFVSVVTRGLAWDGEAFVWHGLVNSNGERTLTVARFDTDGQVVLAPTLVGPPSTSIWNNYDMVTDPESGTSWMVAPGRDAVRVTGTKRDGTPLVPMGQSLPLLGSIDSNGSANDAHVASGPSGEALLTFTVSLDGLIAQRVNSELEELGSPVLVPDEVIDGRPFDFRENASAYAQETWWLFATTGLGVDGYRLGADSVERFEFIHYPAREIREETGSYPTLMLMDWMSTHVWQDEIWLGVLDESTLVLGGTVAPYRVLLVEPGCVYPSFYDLTQ
jgi:hypothetical protein